MHYSSECSCRPAGHTGAAFYIHHMLRLLDYSYPLNWSHRAVYRHSCQSMLKKLQKYIILAFFYFSKPLTFPLLSDATLRHRTDVEKACLSSSI